MFGHLMMFKLARLAWYWLRSRYAVPNAFVRCDTCPNWIFHSKSLGVTHSGTGFYTEGGGLPLPFYYRSGICALDKPKVFNDFTTGFALKVWTGHDWCPRHPLYESNIVQGSDLEYRPGEATLGRAGFNRLPTFQEAVALALKNRDGSVIIAQEADQEPSQDNTYGTPQDNHNAR